MATAVAVDSYLIVPIHSLLNMSSAWVSNWEHQNYLLDSDSVTTKIPYMNQCGSNDDAGSELLYHCETDAIHPACEKPAQQYWCKNSNDAGGQHHE